MGCAPSSTAETGEGVRRLAHEPTPAQRPAQPDSEVQPSRLHVGLLAAELAEAEDDIAAATAAEADAAIAAEADAAAADAGGGGGGGLKRRWPQAKSLPWKCKNKPHEEIARGSIRVRSNSRVCTID